MTRAFLLLMIGFALGYTAARMKFEAQLEDAETTARYDAKTRDSKTERMIKEALG